jgi:Leucine-rich repeat (LRR) protein
MVKIQVETNTGFRKELEFGKRESEIILENRNIESIDLTPLSSCKKLVTLDLIGNSIEEIDLSPLSSCKKIQRLWLKDNELDEIDLTSLGACRELRELSITGNHLREIDLRPLQECTNLELLGLGDNQLKTIDLTPLTDCRHLDTLYLYTNRFKTIDLSLLKSLSEFKKLYLYWNELQELDLSPLSSCTKLDILQLQSNLLTTIDLTPLRTCMLLGELNLSRNRLTSIDLEPLSACTQLDKFGLSDNQLQELDLSPLVMCENLSVVYLDGNRYRRLDLTPLAPSSRLASSSFEVNFKVSSSVEWFETLYSKDNFWHLPNEIQVPLHYDLPVFCRNLRVINRILTSIVKSESKWKTTHLLHNMLSLLDLGWLGMLDVDARTLLRELLHVHSEDGREAVMDQVFTQVLTQIDAGLTTIGLDLQRIAEYSELVDKYDKVIDLRKRELEQVEVLATDSGLDLRPLWLTAYGSLVLNSLGFGTSCGPDDIEILQQALSKLGCTLHIIHSGTIQNKTKVSNTLKEYIWRLADYQSRLRTLGLEDESH